MRAQRRLRKGTYCLDSRAPARLRLPSSGSSLQRRGNGGVLVVVVVHPARRAFFGEVSRGCLLSLPSLEVYNDGALSTLACERLLSVCALCLAVNFPPFVRRTDAGTHLSALSVEATAAILAASSERRRCALVQIESSLRQSFTHEWIKPLGFHSRTRPACSSFLVF